ncbi:bifunctional diguanylate cyclase/phosphodiesterase [Rubrivivax rivuli]|uniref:Bifunctional diguanylate cyclase/phosphodiesterase n=1 Tax=Rubrivivax rivuli TaxID=1862385 RepID=A0A437RES3_9BURK|nr:bifunctional diguanylate cyclase/phosphodiesterase [Rubrivivax rivuli]RVU45258.1 bifunctional diguanylate cyclase/phosphodiesterase [Rubrivivax rivuli]
MPPASNPTSPVTARAGDGEGLRANTGPRRVRWAMYLAFAVLALAVGLQGLAMMRLESMRSADAEILDRAGLQRTFLQKVARTGAMLALAETDGERKPQMQGLQDLLAQSAQDALALEHQLAQQMARSPDAQQLAAQPLERWQDAREKLWYRAQALLLSAEIGGADGLRQRVTALHQAADPAMAAAQGLSDALRRAAELRAERMLDEMRWGMAGILVLLGLLGLAVVEPTARAVQRHGQRLREQAAELQRLALVAEHTSALVLITDGQDRIVWANSAFTRSTGWPLADAFGRRPGELLGHPQADEAVLTRVQQALREGQGVRQEWLHRARDGRDLWLDVDLRPLLDEAGAITGHVRVCSDTSARVQQQAKLRTLWAALPVGVTVMGPDGQVIEANLEAERMLGLSRQQLQGFTARQAQRHLLRADGTPYRIDDLPAMRTLSTRQPVHNETMGVRRRDGSVGWLLVNTLPQTDASGQVMGLVACFSDITESRALQERLRANARTDALTRLPNRDVVMERLQRAIGHARRHPGYGFAVLFMDFDRFKQVNDTLGHGAGDELLRQIAQRLLRALRPGDAVARLANGDEPGAPMAARLGGDEFVVVLDGISDPERVAGIAHRLLAELSEPYTLENMPVQSSVSIGVVLCKEAAATADEDFDASVVAEEVLRNADTAMYEAKRAGRARWVLFDDSMHERVVRALEVEGDLRRALKEDELFVVYQPVVDLADRCLVGVEALVRWRHPQRGLVPPGEFIAIAEESGLIDALGAFVLETACRQFVQWQQRLGAAGPKQLAVNMSRAQLQRNGLVEDVRAVLQANGMTPAHLQLEVTESLAAQDERVQTTLRELKALGVRLALDDFGTGYSSLACLHQMPVDTVKVDRSFVKHAETVEYHRVLIEATIRVARTMGMTTVAEGIETEGQAELMRTLTCDRGQGYLFARPLEAAELERWAAAQAQHRPAALAA